MLTYQQLEIIATILHWETSEVEQAVAELNAGFMTPDVQEFCFPDEDCEITEAGIYYRLSASGYLDCTDWHGPFETEEQAVADMISTYCD